MTRLVTSTTWGRCFNSDGKHIQPLCSVLYLSLKMEDVGHILHLNIPHYRPINSIPIAHRIINRFIKKQLTTYIINRKLLSAHWHGLLQKKLCATRMIDYLNTLTAAANA